MSAAEGRPWAAGAEAGEGEWERGLEDSPSGLEGAPAVPGDPWVVRGDSHGRSVGLGERERPNCPKWSSLSRLLTEFWEIESGGRSPKAAAAAVQLVTRVPRRAWDVMDLGGVHAVSVDGSRRRSSEVGALSLGCGDREPERGWDAEGVLGAVCGGLELLDAEPKVLRMAAGESCLASAAPSTSERWSSKANASDINVVPRASNPDDTGRESSMVLVLA